MWVGHWDNTLKSVVVVKCQTRPDLKESVQLHVTTILFYSPELLPQTYSQISVHSQPLITILNQSLPWSKRVQPLSEFKRSVKFDLLPALLHKVSFQVIFEPHDCSLPLTPVTKTFLQLLPQTRLNNLAKDLVITEKLPMTHAPSIYIH